MVMKVYFTNMGYFSQEEFRKTEDALAYVKSRGFEATIWEQNNEEFNLLCDWSPIGGTRWY